MITTGIKMLLHIEGEGAKEYNHFYCIRHGDFYELSECADCPCCKTEATESRHVNDWRTIVWDAEAMGK